MFQLVSQRRSGTGPESVEIHVENDLNHALHFCWLDFDGKEVLCGTCVSSQTWSQNTGADHSWSLQNEANEEVACVVFPKSGRVRASSIVAASYFRVPHQRKSTYDPKGDVTMKLVNDTAVQSPSAGSTTMAI